MERLTYPRLPDAVARELAATRKSMSSTHLVAESSTSYQGVWYSAVNLQRAEEEHLRELQRGLRQLADEAALGTASARTRLFDQRATELLWRTSAMSANEASQRAVWSFIACVLVPDVVRRRFAGDEAGGTSAERFLGGPRNAFSRLWWRAHALHDPDSPTPLWIVDQLLEDGLVQIVERSAISAGHPPLARSFAKAIIESPTGAITGGQETLIRDAVKRLRRRAALVAFEALTDAEVAAQVREIVSESVRALSPAGSIELPTRGYVASPSVVPVAQSSTVTLAPSDPVEIFEWVVAHVWVGFGQQAPDPTVTVQWRRLLPNGSPSRIEVTDPISQRSFFWTLTQAGAAGTTFSVSGLLDYAKARNAASGDRVRLAMHDGRYVASIVRRD